MTAQSIISSLLEDESPQEAYDRIKASIIADANAYAGLSQLEKIEYWLRHGKIPTPGEEPDAYVRRRVASRIPAGLLTRLLTLAEEPSGDVRYRIARQIPAELLTRLLTQSEEPDAEVRSQVARRIPQ